jgi:hypothetical protein
MGFGLRQLSLSGAQLVAAAPVPGTWVAPTIAGVGALAAGTTSATPAIPAGYQDNDIILIVADSSNELVNTPAGYTALTPYGVGTTGATSAARVSLFWKRASGVEADPALTGTTVHVSSTIVLVRGCPPSQNPIMQEVGGASSIAPGGTMTFGTFDTTVDNALVLNAVSRAAATAGAIYSGVANAALADVTERFDAGTTLGGGIGIFTGVKAVAGSIGSTTVVTSQGGNTGRQTVSFRPTFFPD